MTDVKRISKKIVLLGDPSVGKTSVARKFVYDIFDDIYISTLGTKVTKKQIVYDDLFKNTRVELTMLVWDVMGQHDFSKYHQVAYTGCMGGIIVCDISRKETIKNWEYWRKSLFDSEGQIPLILIGNKYDLANNHKPEIELFQTLTKESNYPTFFTSAKTGENIETAFYLMGKSLLKKDF
jgi:small GTP-binding protein